MGYWYEHPTKHKLIAHLTPEHRQYTTEDNTPIVVKTLAKCIRGNILWAVKEYTKGSSTPTRYIACFILAKSGGLWGYKDMDESMHPYYYSCPISYLEMTPPTCEEWRAKVRWNSENRKRISSNLRKTKLFFNMLDPT